MSKRPQAVGVDWASGSWVAVESADGFEAAAFSSIEELWTEYGRDAERIVVDVPIGLRGSDDGSDTAGEDGRSRRCDELARGVLGWPRSSSVFTPPSRWALAAVPDDPEASLPYEQMNERNRAETSKGLTRQAANIARPIAAVDDLLRGPGDPATLLEGHPELCFRALAGEPLAGGKQTAQGVAERLEVLETRLDDASDTWRGLAGALGEASVGLDDLLDALVLAVTARAPDDEFQRLPGGEVPRDVHGLPMQMVYRRDQPFETEE